MFQALGIEVGQVGQVTTLMYAVYVSLLECEMDIVFDLVLDVSQETLFNQRLNDGVRIWSGGLVVVAVGTKCGWPEEVRTKRRSD